MNDKSNTREFSRDITYTYCEQENINSSFNVLIETVLDTYNHFVDKMKGILCDFYTIIRDNIFLELQILGDLEWCYLEIEELEDSKLLDTSPIYLKEHLDNNGQESIKEIDEYISSFFTIK